MLSSMLLGEGFLPLLCWSVVCWMLGVGYAAYRAVGWVDRMRAWADTVDVEADDTPRHSDHETAGQAGSGLGRRPPAVAS